jgi:hypothetical protein
MADGARRFKPIYRSNRGRRAKAFWVLGSSAECDKKPSDRAINQSIGYTAIMGEAGDPRLPQGKPSSYQETLTPYRQALPNLGYVETEGRSTEYVYELCKDLISLAELYNLTDRVREIGVHGSIPTMLVLLGEEPDRNGKLIEKFGRLYVRDISGQPPQYVTNGWDPELLSLPRGEQLFFGDMWAIDV